MGEQSARKRPHRILQMSLESAAIGDVGFKRPRLLRYLVEMRYVFLLHNCNHRNEEVDLSWKAVWMNMLRVVSQWTRGERDEDHEVVVYRRAMKFMIIGGLRYREKRRLSNNLNKDRVAENTTARLRNVRLNEVIQGDVPANSDFEEQNRFIKAVVTAFPMFGQVYSFACQILPADGLSGRVLDTRLYDLYMAICDTVGVVDSLPEERDPVRYLDPYWDWQTYYGRGMFKLIPESRKHVMHRDIDFKPSVFLQLMRLYVDARAIKCGTEQGRIIQCPKRGSKRKRESSAEGWQSHEHRKWGNTDNTAFATETVVNAWEIFVRELGFVDISEFCVDFLVFDPSTIQFKVLPESRCVPRGVGGHKLMRVNVEYDRLQKEVGGGCCSTECHVDIASDEASCMLKSLRVNKQALLFWRKCVSDFVTDIDMLGSLRNLLSGTMECASSAPELEPFKVGVSTVIPDRFRYDPSSIRFLTLRVRESRGFRLDKGAETSCIRSISDESADVIITPEDKSTTGNPRDGIICVQRLPLKVLYTLAAMTSEKAFVSTLESRRSVDQYSSHMISAMRSVEIGFILGSTLGEAHLMLEKSSAATAELNGLHTVLITLRAIEKGALVGYSHGIFLDVSQNSEAQKVRLGIDWFDVNKRVQTRCGLIVTPESESVIIGTGSYDKVMHVPGKHCPFRYAIYNTQEDEVNCNVQPEVVMKRRNEINILKSHCFVAMRAIKHMTIGDEIRILKVVKIKSR